MMRLASLMTTTEGNFNRVFIPSVKLGIFTSLSQMLYFSPVDAFVEFQINHKEDRWWWMGILTLWFNNNLTALSQGVLLYL
jgi:hypothetical protein